MDLLNIINKAGRQRMLTQELMKLYLIKSYNVPYSRDVNQDLLDCVEQFNQTHVLLQSISANSLRVKLATEKVHDAWLKFISSFEFQNMDDVIDLNKIVLEEMDQLVTELILQFSKKHEVLT